MASILDRPNSIEDLRAEEQNRSSNSNGEMSYADIAAKGPQQSDEEKMPDPIPEIAHDDSSVHTLDSVYGVKSVPSSTMSQNSSDDPLSETADAAEKSAEDFGRKAESAADDLARDAKPKYEEAKKDTKAKVNQLGQEANQTYKQVKKEGKQDFDEAAHDAKVYADKAEKKAKEVGREAKKDLKKGEDWAERNKGNPVVIGNMFVIAAVAGVLGVGGYRKHQAGELTWKVAGAYAGVVGLLATADYFVSSWLFTNKYPPKK
ncbi:hypothetical protein B0A48_11739 [Cryoendolithus antarcticus]|uniref:Uncharacterized protein n=1 Tax=Cryoendolithus antarcticus TaxID=1507870 RepID=A0A1V8SSL8_9PEZI|nr:hypothetical protein B0A48_11739 [Cryoendolithus antarcticus]